LHLVFHFNGYTVSMMFETITRLSTCELYWLK